MDALVHEGRDQQRHPDEQVPDEAKAGQRILPDMRQLMDEAARAVEGEHRDEARDQHPARRGREDRHRDAGIADDGRGEEIGPIDARAGVHEIARQF